MRTATVARTAQTAIPTPKLNARANQKRFNAASKYYA